MAIDSPITRADIPELCERVRAALELGGRPDPLVCDMSGVDAPDAVTVEALARLQLTAHRLGSRMEIRHACDELRELLTFTGLCEVVPDRADLPLEAGRQAEEREQRPRVEEERDPGDPAA